MSSNEPKEDKGNNPQRESSRASREIEYEKFKKKHQAFKIYPFEIKKLSEDNAINWFHKMEEELRDQNAWVAIEYCREKGVHTFMNIREEISDLKSSDAKACAMIRRGLDDEVSSDLREFPTAMQRWDILRERYIRPSASRRSAKFMELADEAREERQSEFVKGWYEFRTIIKQFIEMNGSRNIDIMELGMLWYLCSLPPALNHIRDFLLASKITEEALIQRLGDQDAMDKVKKKGENAQRISQISKCSNCNRMGHSTSDCWSKRGNQRKKEAQNEQKYKKPFKKATGKKKQKAQAVEDEDNDDKSTLVPSVYDTDEDDEFVQRVEDITPVKPQGPAIEWVMRVSSDPSKWCLDSGATSSCTGNKKIFENMKPYMGTLCVANGHEMAIKGRGTVKIQLPSGGKARLNRVLYVPGLAQNLLSLEALHLAGIWTVGSEYGYYILRDGKVVAEGKRHGRTTYLQSVNGLNALFVNMRHRANMVQLALTQENEVEAKQTLIHSRLGHPGRRRFNHCVEIMGMDDLKLRPTDKMLEDDCEICIRAKKTKKQNHAPVPRASRPLQRVYMDFWGPNREGEGEEKYYLSLIDDCTRFSWLYISADRKAETITELLELWMKAAERQAGHMVLIIRTDNALEFHALKPWCSARGIELEFIEPDTPPQNGVAERFNRIVLEVTRALLFDAKVSKKFWKYAVMTANYLRNLTTTVATENGEKKTPHEIWHGHPPELSHLRRWGSRVLYYSKPDSKLDSRVEEGTFVLYGKSTRQYYVIPRGTNTLRLVTSPEFRERQNGYLNMLLPPASSSSIPLLPRTTDSTQIETTPTAYTPPRPIGTMTSTLHQPWLSNRLPPMPAHILPSISHHREQDLPHTLEDPEQPESRASAPNPDNKNTSATNSKPNENELSSHRATLEEPTTVSTHNEPVQHHPDAPEKPDLKEPPPGHAMPPEPDQDIEDTVPEPRRSTRLRQNTERLTESLQQMPRKRKAEGEGTGSPAQRVRINLAMTALANELYSVDREYEVNESICAVKEKAGIPIPTSYKAAVSDPIYGSKWKEAIAAELTALTKFRTWRIISRKQAEGTISSTRWVFDVKIGLDGRVERFKARLVARGNEQSEDDFDNTFAPVFRLESLRILMAIAASYGMIAHVLDAHNAFVGSDLDKPNCMEIPEGLQDFDADAKGSGVVLELRKSLYGLRQSANLWYQKISFYLRKLGFKSTTADPSVFVNGRGMIIAVYVDDLLILGKQEAEIETIKAKLKKFHPMSDGGLVKRMLGIRFQWGKDSVSLDQENYSQQVLQEFGMENCKAISTPLSPSVQLASNESTQLSKTDHKLFRRLIGRLMFLVVATRPDIAFAVNQLSQYLAAPTQVHLGAAKHVLRYVKGTLNYSLTFKAKGSRPKLTVYTDSSYANSAQSRSTTGCIHFIGDAPVSWMSKKQSITAQSSTEAEYIAISEAAKQTIWIRHFLHSIGKQAIYHEAPTTIYEDNQGAIKIAYNPVNHPRTKHMSVRFHAIRGHIESGEVHLEYLSTDKMIADGLTKVTNATTHKRLVDGLRLAPRLVH